VATDTPARAATSRMVPDMENDYLIRGVERGSCVWGNGD